jgi:DNA-binding CsgD family transcriptional regulator
MLDSVSAKPSASHPPPASHLAHLAHVAHVAPPAHPAQRAPQAAARSYQGPDRRHASGRARSDTPAGPPNATSVTWLACMLDEVDYGMLLVTADAQVIFMNHAARLELGPQHPLQLLGQALRAHRPQDVAPLYDALAASQRGLRRLVHLGEAPHRVSLSVVPLPAPISSAAHARATAQGAHAELGSPEALGSGPLTLLVLGKQQSCGALSVQAFAHSVRLTPAETRVLEMLCDGVQPMEIAVQVGVAVSTVRTQVGSIRAKTGAASIRDLVRQVAVLPPMVGALRLGLTCSQ